MNINGEFFNFMVPKQEWFSPKEMASIVGKTDQYIRDAFDNQKILGHTLNGRSPRGKEKRKSYQIHREGVILYLLETANYSSEDFAERIGELIRSKPESVLKKIKALIDNLLIKRN
ncbi:MAG: hypothetical protein LBB11_04130 [Puniceicoccales bacterium]|jgi:hypothetical protein|nr:hypothetical protein [Puniceicoccales bacterium]